MPPFLFMIKKSGCMTVLNLIVFLIKFRVSSTNNDGTARYVLS